MKNNKRRIAIVTAGFAPVPAVKGGAVETLVSQIIEQNENNGRFDLDVFTIADSDLDALHFNNARIIQVQRASRLHSFFVRCFNRICKLFNVQIAHGINDKNIAQMVDVLTYDAVIVENNMHIYQLLKAQCGEYPNFYFHLHNSIVGDPGKSPKLSRIIADSARSVITVSDYIRYQFENYRKEQVFTLYNCVDIKKFSPASPKECLNVRETLMIDPNSWIVLYSGRMTPEKGILELVEAMKIVSQRIKVCLLIVGKQWFGSVTEGVYSKKLNDATSDCDWIHFTGYISHDEMYKLYSVANITVVPSIVDEAFGMSALESLLCETPVICSNRGGLPEVVNDNVGCVVEVNSEFETNLAKKILLLAENNELYNSMKANSRNQMINKFGSVESYYCNFCKYIEL